MELYLESETDDVVKVNATGRLTLHRGPAVYEPLGELIGEHSYGKRVLLNVRDAEYIDSSGLGWLVACQKRFKQAGGRLVLHSIPPQLGNVLRIVRLDSFLHLASNERQAVVLARGETM